MMSKTPTDAPEEWPVPGESSRAAQIRAAAGATPAQRLEWLEQARRLAVATGAFARAETDEERRRRGLL